jgi:hypothetical protein
MAKNQNGYQIKQLVTERHVINNATGTALVTIATGQADDSWVYHIEITSTDTSAQTLQIIHSDGTNDDIIYQISIPALAGQGATVAVGLIQTKLLPSLLLDPSQNYFHNLPNGEFLKAKLASGNVTATKEIRIRVTRGDF